MSNPYVGNSPTDIPLTTDDIVPTFPDADNHPYTSYEAVQKL